MFYSCVCLSSPKPGHLTAEVWMIVAPQAHVFQWIHSLSHSWWNCLKRMRRFSLVEGGVPVGVVTFWVLSKVLLAIPNVSSQLFPPQLHVRSVIKASWSLTLGNLDPNETLPGITCFGYSFVFLFLFFITAIEMKLAVQTKSTLEGVGYFAYCSKEISFYHGLEDIVTGV